jgi:hypothetical protein
MVAEILLESALVAAIPSRHFPCLLASRRRDHRSDLFLARHRCSAGVVTHVFPLNQAPKAS